MDAALARRIWTGLEVVHATVYFSPEVADAMKGVGLKGYWMGYFAGRAAPLGSVPAPVVSATFFNFAPRLVDRAIPDAWSFASPTDVLAARTAAVDATLRRLLGDAVGADDVAEAADLARRAAEAARVEGRSLFAGWASLDWPAEPHTVLWHAATLLREHRGDGHVAALTAAGLDGCEAHVSTVLAGRAAREILQPARGWTDEEWDAAEARLREQGWTSEDRNRIEEVTDRLAAQPFEVLGEEGTARLIDLVMPIAGQFVDAGAVPMPNPMGVSNATRQP